MPKYLKIPKAKIQKKTVSKVTFAEIDFFTPQIGQGISLGSVSIAIPQGWTASYIEKKKATSLWADDQSALVEVYVWPKGDMTLEEALEISVQMFSTEQRCQNFRKNLYLFEMHCGPLRDKIYVYEKHITNEYVILRLHRDKDHLDIQRILKCVGVGFFNYPTKLKMDSYSVIVPHGWSVVELDIDRIKDKVILTADEGSSDVEIRVIRMHGSSLENILDKYYVLDGYKKPTQPKFKGGVYYFPYKTCMVKFQRYYKIEELRVYVMVAVIGDKEHKDIGAILESIRLFSTIPEATEVTLPEALPEPPIIPSQISNYPHPMLQYNLDRGGLGSYLRSLCFIESTSGKIGEGQRHFLSRLAITLGFSDKNFELDHLDSTFLEGYNDNLLVLLDTEEKKRIWMLDGAVLLGLGDEVSIENSVAFNNLLQLIAMRDECDYLTAAFQLPREKKATILWDSLTIIGNKCAHWKHVVDFLGLTFPKVFADLRVQLTTYSMDIYRLKRKIERFDTEVSVSSQLALDAYFADIEAGKEIRKPKNFCDELVSARKTCLTSAQNLKEKVVSFLDAPMTPLSKANRILSFCGIATLEVDVKTLRSTDFGVDCSTANNHWKSEISELGKVCHNTLTAAEEVTYLLRKYLQLLEGSNFKTSTEEIMEKKKKDLERLKMEYPCLVF